MFLKWALRGLLFAPLFFSVVACDGSSSAQLFCSGTTVAGTRYIRNGDPAPSCANTSIALLESTVGSDQFYCSGVLIRPNVVLTAGHCVAGGSRTINVTLGGHGAVVSNSQMLHPGYQPNGYPIAGVDVGLVLLSRPLTDVAPLKLNVTPPPLQAAVTAIGFGLNGLGQDGNGSVGTLLEGALQVISYVKGTNTTAPAGIIAHASTSKSQETCDGDSGGPLLYQGQVVGILSGGDAKGQRCVDSTTSSYTSVAAALPWITSQIGN